MLDLKIVNGTVVDGSGCWISRKVVSPGFIDVHTHYDAQVFWDPALTPSSNHGVTSVFGGFCGFSIAPLAPTAGEYLMHMLAHVEGMPLATLQAGVPWDWSSFGSYLERLEGKVAVNAGFCAGHSAIRRWVMGERAVGEQATKAEIEQMQNLLRRSIEEGAMGFSSSISPTHNDANSDPVPSRHASYEELLATAACRVIPSTGELSTDRYVSPAVRGPRRRSRGRSCRAVRPGSRGRRTAESSPARRWRAS